MRDLWLMLSSYIILFGTSSPPSNNFYVAEDGTTFYITESGANNYIPES